MFDFITSHWGQGSYLKLPWIFFFLIPNGEFSFFNDQVILGFWGHFMSKAGSPYLLHPLSFIGSGTKLFLSHIETVSRPQGQGNLVCRERSEWWRGRGPVWPIAHAGREQRSLVSPKSSVPHEVA